MQAHDNIIIWIHNLSADTRFQLRWRQSVLRDIKILSQHIEWLLLSRWFSHYIILELQYFHAIQDLSNFLRVCCVRLEKLKFTMIVFALQALFAIHKEGIREGS